MCNRIKLYAWVILITVFIFSFSPSKAYAFVMPAIDFQSIILNVKSYFTKVMESETVVKTIKTVKKTSAAIGTAKKTVTEYITEGKEKIEEQLERVNEYKKQAEEYKKQYEEYKAKIDEGIKTAEKYKNDVKKGIDTAKDAIDSAPDIAKGIKNKVNDKVSEATDKVKKVLPDNGNKPDVKEPENKNPTIVNNQQQLQPDIDNNPVIIPAENDNTPTSSRKTFVNTPPSSANINSDNNSVNSVVETAPSVVDNNPVIISTENDNKPSSGKIIITPPSPSVNINSGNNPANPIIETVQPVIIQRQAPMVVEKSSNGIAVPSQKIDVQPELQMPQVQINKLEEGKIVETIQNNDVLSDKNTVVEADDDLIENNEQNEESVKALDEIKIEQNGIKQIKTPNKEGIETTPQSNRLKIEQINDKAISVQPISRRKAFTTSSVSRSDKVSFAKALVLPDNGTDVNGTMVIPPAMALACGISSSTAVDKDTVDNCLVWLNEEIRKDQADNPYNAPEVFNKIVSTYPAAVMAESYKALNDAEHFEEQYVDPVEFAPDNNAQDTYANIIELNKNIDMQMNNLLKIHSTILAAKVIENYYSYGFVNYENPEIVVAETMGKDNGTGADNVFKIPQQMALTCGLDSESVKDVTLTDECFNTLANIPEKDGFYLIRDIILHQANKTALELALKVKSEAGDFEDKQEEALKDEDMGLPESPAAIGTEAEDEGANIRAAQEKNSKLTALSANNLLTLMDLYSMQTALDTLVNFYQFDVTSRKASNS